jgi:proline iminopeptidase
LAFARLVTHYVAHDFFLEDGIVLRNTHVLEGIPGVLVHGANDLMAPIANAWELQQAWHSAELVVVDDEGHAGNQPGIEGELIRATDRFAPDR